MKRLAAALSIAFVTSALAQQVHASACSMDRYMHNGSVMDIQVCDGGTMTISYAQPRPGMAQQGVRSGTLLFDGVEGQGGAIAGQSRLFSARCGVVSYAVSGSRQGEAIVLNGTAPIRGQGCQVVRTRQDNLVFTPVASGPSVAPAQCPPGFVPSGGQCIRAGSDGGAVAGGGDWYAIAGSFRTQNQAQSRIAQLGGGAWTMMNTAQCPNFTNGYWIATAGPFSKGQAQAYAASANHFGAYVKTCH